MKQGVRVLGRLVYGRVYAYNGLLSHTGWFYHLANTPFLVVVNMGMVTLV